MKNFRASIGPDIVCSKNKASNSIFLSPCSPQEVYHLINQLKEKKAKRASDIETKFIKYANPVLSYFVSDIFNRCLTEGVYPDSLKVAEVIPIFNKGDRDKTTNYRPILLLSQFNKVFEKLLYTRIYSYLMRFDMLSDRQFGFRKNSSTMLAINKIFEELLSDIDEGLYSCCIFLNLSKAFDTVNHKILLKKLENSFGLRGTSLKLIENYLTDRYQCTKIGEARSSLRKVDCGVPQGSSLGPFIFFT